MRTLRATIIFLSLVAAAGCGGGSNNDSGSSSAVSGHVPYLLSKPTVTFAVNAGNISKYDLTVTVQADGPTGVLFADAFVVDDTNTNFAFIDLVHLAGTTWKGSTNTLVPLPPGSYLVKEITLNDGDPISADPLRTGWYMYDDFFSTSLYFVDERETSGVNFVFYNAGLSDISVARFTLP